LLENRYAESIEPFNEAIKLDPGFTIAYNGRGFARYLLKQYAEAIMDYDRAIQLNPGYANAYLNRSNARRAVGDKAGADSDMVKFRELSAAAQR
jgi:tetratricopeptide (TPR) repeat protein